MTVHIDSDRRLLRAVLAGTFDPEDAERTFVEVLDAVALRKSHVVLIDGRQLAGEPDVIHRFLYGEFAALTAKRYVLARRIPDAAQFAYVLQEPVLDPMRFGEAVALHWGMNVKAFENPEVAMEWLGMGAGSGMLSGRA